MLDIVGYCQITTSYLKKYNAGMCVLYRNMDNPSGKGGQVFIPLLMLHGPVVCGWVTDRNTVMCVTHI